MKRKLFSVILMIAIMTIAFGLSACNREPAVGSISNVGNESFKGQISEQSYTNTEEAAKAFLGNELEGKTSKTNFVSYDKKKDISREEIEKLPLGELSASDVTSAEEGTITYELITVGENTYAAESDNTRTQTVYFLEVNGTYYYFVPEARNGEMISGSYYEDFWDLDHYRNCTMNSSMELKIDMEKDDLKVNASVKIIIDLMVSETAAYMKTNVTVEASGDNADELKGLLAGSLGGSALQNMEIYLVEKDGKLIGAMREGESWRTVTSMFDSMEDFYEEYNQQPEFLDHTYFVKTDTGFKIDPSKIKLYVSNYNPMFAQMLGSCELKAEYTVEKERMTSCVSEISASMSQNGAIVRMGANSYCNYKDYGATTVTIPEDLTKHLEALDKTTEE